jgi:hypothetical protein
MYILCQNWEKTISPNKNRNPQHNPIYIINPQKPNNEPKINPRLTATVTIIPLLFKTAQDNP